MTFPLNDKHSNEVNNIINKTNNTNNTNTKNKKKKIQNQLLLNSLVKFYKKKTNVKIIMSIVNGESNISLRLIDWFVTNYSKKQSIYIYKNKDKDKHKEQINVYTDYRSQLKAYSKQLFDPFRRRERINFYFDETTWLQTTSGQLNFFRWAIESNILKYIEENLEIIEKDMIQSQKLNQEKKNDKNNIKIKITKTANGKEIVVTRKKRNELSKSISKNIIYNNSKRTIFFD
jgi:hypothetical protein